MTRRPAPELDAHLPDNPLPGTVAWDRKQTRDNHRKAEAFRWIDHIKAGLRGEPTTAPDELPLEYPDPDEAF